MGLRIMQLQYEVNKNESIIVDGFEMWLSFRRKNYFGLPGDGIKISSWDTPEEKRNVKTVHAFEVKKLADKFKEIFLFGLEQKVEEENEILLLVNAGTVDIDASKINKIAGRYETGAFILKPNDKIIVKYQGFTEEFVALQFEKKMYLVKIHD